MSHSQGFHHQNGVGGVFGYSSDGFDRPGSKEEQQGRRGNLMVQGFDPAAAGASNMLAEMFNFSALTPSGPSAAELLAGQMNANYRFGFRQGQGAVADLPGDGDWFGSGGPGRAGVVLGGANLGSLGETSSPKQQGGMAGGLANDPAAAMQLILMNPQLQQQSRSSPASPPSSDAQSSIHQHHEAFQPFAGGGAGVVEGQGLSLSLSPSLQQLEMAKHAEEQRVRVDGVLCFNRQHQQAAPAAVQHLHSQVGSPGQQLHVGYGPAAVASVLRSSKYTRAAQELLDEFCSVGRGQTTTINGGARASASTIKQGGGPSSSGAAHSPSPASKDPPPLSPADRFEHQRKKAKLISMIDEVDRRYSHYCDQMQMVVNLFDSVMGFGAATPYTALARKAMSRHFRCLKDAVAGQLRRACELLGEKDAGAGAAGAGLTKGQTPRLRAIDQSLRQQRAFHPMGVVEQEAWRPQRGLPERSVTILRSWLFEHFLHPYPSDADKHLLARQTGLSRNQVSNWFINARVRLWKPMIEEMYQQETKELDGGDVPECGNDPCGGADDTRSPTSATGGTSGGVHHHKLEPGVPGPSAAEAAFIGGIDPVELLGGDADELYARFEPAVVRMRYGPTAAAPGPPGDVSLTLGLQHAGAGSDGTGRRFSLRDYGGC